MHKAMSDFITDTPVVWALLWYSLKLWSLSQASQHIIYIHIYIWNFFHTNFFRIVFLWVWVHLACLASVCHFVKCCSSSETNFAQFDFFVFNLTAATFNCWQLQESGVLAKPLGRGRGSLPWRCGRLPNGNKLQQALLSVLRLLPRHSDSFLLCT